MIHWFWHWTGAKTGTGHAYLEWSGFLSIWIPLIAASLVYWRHNTCHQHRCVRIGKHPIVGTPYTVCRRHHPEMPDRSHHTEIKDYPS